MIIRFRLVAVFVLFGISVQSLAQTDEFREPWNDPTRAIILDTYQGNSIEWDQLANDQRVVAIIHRATKGAAHDTAYDRRKTLAKKLGLRWGSYHLGLSGDPVKQADFYLATAKPESDELIGLDIESLNTHKDMSLENARRFILRIKEKTNRYPVIYGNDEVIRQIVRKYGRDQVFTKTLLWYAWFRSDMTDFPKGTWDTYTFWQFSSEINCAKHRQNMCLYRAPGTEYDMDVNVYNGSVEDLKKDWPFDRKQVDAHLETNR